MRRELVVDVRYVAPDPKLDGHDLRRFDFGPLGARIVGAELVDALSRGSRRLRKSERESEHATDAECRKVFQGMPFARKSPDSLTSVSPPTPQEKTDRQGTKSRRGPRRLRSPARKSAQKPPPPWPPA